MITANLYSDEYVASIDYRYHNQKRVHGWFWFFPSCNKRGFFCDHGRILTLLEILYD